MCKRKSYLRNSYLFLELLFKNACAYVEEAYVAECLKGVLLKTDFWSIVENWFFESLFFSTFRIMIQFFISLTTLIIYIIHVVIVFVV